MPPGSRRRWHVLTYAPVASRHRPDFFCRRSGANTHAVARHAQNRSNPPRIGLHVTELLDPAFTASRTSYITNRAALWEHSRPALERSCLASPPPSPDHLPTTPEPPWPRPTAKTGWKHLRPRRSSGTSWIVMPRVGPCRAHHEPSQAAAHRPGSAGRLKGGPNQAGSTNITSSQDPPPSPCASELRKPALSPSWRRRRTTPSVSRHHEACSCARR